MNVFKRGRLLRNAEQVAGEQSEKHRPRFVSRNDSIQSFRNTMPIRRMDGNRYPLSRKLGSVRIRKRDRLRYPIENLSSWTVKRENRTYCLVLLFDVDIQPKTPVEGQVCIIRILTSSRC